MLTRPRPWERKTYVPAPMPREHASQKLTWANCSMSSSMDMSNVRPALPPSAGVLETSSVTISATTQIPMEKYASRRRNSAGATTIAARAPSTPVTGKTR